MSDTTFDVLAALNNFFTFETRSIMARFTTKSNFCILSVFFSLLFNVYSLQPDKVYTIFKISYWKRNE